MPKAELVSKLQAMLHSGHLKISRSLPDAPVLVPELQDFRVRYTEASRALNVAFPAPATELKVTWARR